MTVSEYAKYVVSNMNRATLGNALNIVKKFETEYNFVDFLASVDSYVLQVLNSNLLDKSKCYNILYLTNNALKKYNSNFNYNKNFIMDDFIIDLWGVINGD